MKNNNLSMKNVALNLNGFLGRHKWILPVAVTILLIVLFFASFDEEGNKTTEKNPSPTTFPRAIDSNGTTRIYEERGFTITFFPSNQEYVISITGSPFEDIRAQAETLFLQKLLISRAQACVLKVSINTPHFANPDFSGKVLPLSFCVPNSPQPNTAINPLLEDLIITKTHPFGKEFPVGGTRNGVTLYFTKAVDENTAQVMVVPQIKTGVRTHPTNKTEMYIIPEAPWVSNQTYNITIKAGLLSQEQSAQLKKDFTFTFTATEVKPYEELPQGGI